MSDRYLVSVTTPSYVPKTGQYFQSVGHIRSAKKVCVLLDFTPETYPDGAMETLLRDTFPFVEYRHLTLPWSHSNYMIQHGPFLDAIPEAKDDDLICLTDMDVTVQRDFTAREWEYFEGLGPHQLSATWNGGRSDNLKIEGGRIGLTDEWMAKWWSGAGHPEDTPCFNCGVMIGRVSAFRELQKGYESLCQRFYAASPHRSRCQWLINYCVDQYLGGWVPLPPATHTHFHFRMDDGRYVLPRWTEVEGRVVREMGTPTVFVHNFPR
jgi:hypothetical protein